MNQLWKELAFANRESKATQVKSIPRTVQRPSTDRPTDRCKKCTDRTDRENFEEVTELKPFLTRSVRSVYFLQQSVEQSVDGLWTVPASRVSNPS